MQRISIKCTVANLGTDAQRRIYAKWRP